MRIKRAPLLGRVKYIIIILLVASTCTSIYFKNECKKLTEINNSLNATIDDLKADNDMLNNQIIELKKESTLDQELKSKTLNGNQNLGNFKITAYCNCEKCCGKWAGGKTASGTIPTEDRTIAVDTNIIPFGTQVIIDGKTYIAEDTGSAIKGNRIDIYFDSHQEALNWGVKYKNVSVIK